MTSSDQNRMPAEWEPHAATWLSWPRRSSLSFPDEHWDRARPEYLGLARAIAESEPVYINVLNEEEAEEIIRDIGRDYVDQIHPLVIPTDEPWCRDHGPTFVLNQSGKSVAIDWIYNAWGEKYTPYERDKRAASIMAEALGIATVRPPLVAEGGAIEVDGQGHLLSTTSCLLHPCRNPDLSLEDLEAILRRHLGVRRISWLKGEIPGDDTDSHIDTFARFASPEIILSSVPPEKLFENSQTLEGIEVIPLPQPPSVTWKKRPLPASYANFVITNRSILIPAYGSAADQDAASILQDHFPTREIRLLPSRELIFGLGSFHCLTQQLPA